MKREEKKHLKLMQYGIKSDQADRLVELGYSVTKLRNTTVKELTNHFEIEVAKEIKEKTKRKPIHEDTLRRLLGESDWACCICFDVRRQPIIVHHIEPYASTQDNSYENLIVLCPNHHATAHTSSTLTGESLPPEFLHRRKIEFAKAITEWKSGKRTAPNGISDTFRLSEPLLQELCRHNLDLYARQNEFLTDSDKWIDRELDSPTDNPMTSIKLLIGEAGFGKSIYSFQILKNHFDLGGFGLWMQPSFIEDSSSLIMAIEKLLQELNPQLKPRIAEDLKKIIPKNTRFLIVVDDLNRNETKSPTQLLEKLLLWSRNPKADEVSIQIVCPVWPRFWDEAKRRFGGELPWVNVLNVGPMTVSEAISAIQKTTFSTTSISVGELVYRLGYDPFLIGIVSSQASMINVLMKPENESQEVIKRFINHKIQDACQMPLVASDYHQALTKLVSKMLKIKNLSPTWPQIRSWFHLDLETLQALGQLSQNRQLCKLDLNERFLFRHDRILEAIAVDSINQNLEMSLEDTEVLCEPHYAEWVGQALAQSQVSEQLLEIITEKSPLALVEAIKWFDDPVTAPQLAVIHGIKRWMNNHWRGRREHIADTLYDSILLSLMRTDSKVILDITDSYRDDNWEHWRLLARFRNGCAQSGIEYCTRFGATPIWTPSPYDSRWYQIIEHAKQKHGDKIVSELKESCSIPNNDRAYQGTLLLAAFLGIPVLVESIMSGWQKQSDKMQSLAFVITACIRCYSSEYTNLLDNLIAYWAELPDVKEIEKPSIRESILTKSPAALSFGFSEEAIAYLLIQVKKYDLLKPAIAQALRTFDHPETLEFVIKTIAEIKQLSPQMDFGPDSNYWIWNFLPHWISSQQKGYGLSSASIDKMKSLWKNQENNKFIRELAFQLWFTASDPSSLDLLKKIPASSELFSDALEARMQLGDESVVQELLPILSEEVTWLRFADRIWCDELVDVVNKHLVTFKDEIPPDYSGGNLDEHFVISRLLTRIPEKDSEQLLVNNWDHLGYSGLFIISALYVGSPTCLTLADRSIRSCPVEIEILKFWDWVGSEMDLDYLQNLEPYLERFNDTDIGRIAETCEKFGEQGIYWRRTHLLTILDRRGMRQNYEPTLEELVDRLDNYAKNQNPFFHVDKWVKDFKKIDTDRDPLETLEPWFASNPTHHRFNFVAAYIDLMGTRDDLIILDKYPVEYGHLFNIDQIKESTKFAVKRRTLE